MVGFSRARQNALAEIFRDVGQVFFAPVFVEPIVAGSTTSLVFFSGIALALVSWFLSFLLSKNV